MKQKIRKIVSSMKHFILETKIFLCYYVSQMKQVIN